MHEFFKVALRILLETDRDSDRCSVILVATLTAFWLKYCGESWARSIGWSFWRSWFLAPEAEDILGLGPNWGNKKKWLQDLCLFLVFWPPLVNSPLLPPRLSWGLPKRTKVWRHLEMVNKSQKLWNSTNQNITRQPLPLRQGHSRCEVRFPPLISTPLISLEGQILTVLGLTFNYVSRGTHYVSQKLQFSVPLLVPTLMQS